MCSVLKSKRDHDHTYIVLLYLPRSLLTWRGQSFAMSELQFRFLAVMVQPGFITITISRGSLR